MSSAIGQSICVGARLSGPSGVGSCTVGGFARGADDSTLAVTIWHAFASETNSDVHIVKSSVRVGSLLPRAGRELTRAPFWTALGLVRLDDGITLSDAAQQTEYAPLFAASIDTVLGSEVRRFGVPDTIGKVTGTYGMLRLTNPLDGRTIVYEDTLEVRFSGTSGLVKGDAGSLVITDTGEAVGLIVAGTLGACYVAPLAPLLEKENLSLISASTTANRGAYGDFISAHNRQIRESLRTEKSFDLGPMPTHEAA